MKGLAITSIGLEGVARENIIEIIGHEANASTEKSVVIFEAETLEELCKICYKSQAAARILLYLGKLPLSNLSISDSGNADEKNMQLQKLFGNIDMKSLIRAGSSFRARCGHLGVLNADMDVDITDLEKSIGSAFIDYCDNAGLSLHVDLKNPDMTMHGHIIDENIYIGLDLSGDISKRDYRVFNSPSSLKGTSAFGLLMIAGYKKGDVLVDTFCSSGTIPIEAALYACNISPRFYNKEFPFSKLNIFEDDAAERFFKELDDGSANPGKIAGMMAAITAADTQLRNVTAAKKNAKMAGVEKSIVFRRIDTDWLEMKFAEDSVDKIITFIPGSSRHKSERQEAKFLKEFFYQAEYILKKSGTLSVLCLSKEMLLETSKEYFSLASEKIFYSGGQEMHVLMFRHRGVK